jgi:hypothetical protein
LRTVGVAADGAADAGIVAVAVAHSEAVHRSGERVEDAPSCWRIPPVHIYMSNPPIRAFMAMIVCRGQGEDDCAGNSIVSSIA